MIVQMFGCPSTSPAISELSSGSPAWSSFPTRFSRIGTHRSLHTSINKNRSGDHAGERGGSTLRGVSRGNQPCHARQRGHIRLSQASRAANSGFSHPNKRKIWAIPKKVTIALQPKRWDFRLEEEYRCIKTTQLLFEVLHECGRRAYEMLGLRLLEWVRGNKLTFQVHSSARGW